MAIELIRRRQKLHGWDRHVDSLGEDGLEDSPPDLRHAIAIVHPIGTEQQQHLIVKEKALNRRSQMLRIRNAQGLGQGS